MSEPFPLRWRAYVLAGGGSVRLGQDKARAQVAEERTVIEAVIASLREAFSSWTVVADRADKFEDLGLRTIADTTPGRGPLAGILRALEDGDDEYIFITSCDRMGLKQGWVSPLAAALRDGPDAVIFVHDGYREPLFGFYRTDLVPRLRDFVDDGGRAVWRFLDDIDAPAIPAPSGWDQTFSVNTVEELRRAREITKKRGGDI